MTQHVIIVIGTSSVGKSTLIKEMIKNDNNLVQLGVDFIWNELAQLDNTFYKLSRTTKLKLVYVELIKRVKKILKETKNNIITDDISNNIIDLFNDNNIKIKTVFLYTSLKKLFTNTKKRTLEDGRRDVSQILNCFGALYKSSIDKQPDTIMKIKYSDLVDFMNLEKSSNLKLTDDKINKFVQKIAKKLKIPNDNSIVYLIPKIKYDFIINFNIKHIKDIIKTITI
jgi:predicted kinase